MLNMNFLGVEYQILKYFIRGKCKMRNFLPVIARLLCITKRAVDMEAMCKLFQKSDFFVLSTELFFLLTCSDLVSDCAPP
jgi:hypothetical protein